MRQEPREVGMMGLDGRQNWRMWEKMIAETYGAVANARASEKWTKKKLYGEDDRKI